MNKPDENTLNRWLRGELEGEELRKVDAWADDHAGDLDSEFKCGIGWEALGLGTEFTNAVPASVEPPYPDFFNHKLQQTIEADELEQAKQAEQSVAPVVTPVEAEPGISLWVKLRWMLMPTAVAAGVAFYAGSQMTQIHPDTPALEDAFVAYERVYVPDSEVAASFSETDRATEIVLEGLHPISDELDIVKGDTSKGTPPTMMVLNPKPKSSADTLDNQVTFF